MNPNEVTIFTKEVTISNGNCPCGYEKVRGKPCKFGCRSWEENKIIVCHGNSHPYSEWLTCEVCKRVDEQWEEAKRSGKLQELLKNNMNTEQENWEEEFDEQFEMCNGGDAVIVKIDDDGLSTKQYLKLFIRTTLATYKQSLREQFTLLVADEINTARSEEQSTSRLTSLANKVLDLLK